MCPSRSTQLPDELIWEQAAAHHGVVTREQMRALGLSDSQVKHRVRTKRLHRVHRCVYAIGAGRLSPEGRVLAAVLASGNGAITSHRTAGDLWEMRRSASSRIDVTVPLQSRRRPPPPIVLHRAELVAAEAAVHCSVPVTSPARTLMDLATVLDRRSLERATEQAEKLGLFDLRAVQAAMTAHPRHRGTGALMAVLDHWAPVTITRSELEERFLALCAAEGLPPPLANARVGPYEVDFLWPAQRLVVETDGRGHHGTRAAFERDRARDARLAAAGYRVLRFTYRQVVREPAFVADAVRSVLGSAA